MYVMGISLVCLCLYGRVFVLPMVSRQFFAATGNPLKASYYMVFMCYICCNRITEEYWNKSENPWKILKFLTENTELFWGGVRVWWQSGHYTTISDSLRCNWICLQPDTTIVSNCLCPHFQTSSQWEQTDWATTGTTGICFASPLTLLFLFILKD